MSNNRESFNKTYLLLICIIAAMGGLLFGYDWVVIGGAKPFYEASFGIQGNPYQQGLAMSSALIGCIFGAIGTMALSDKLGRKRLLIFSAFLFTLSAVWTALSSGLMTFNIARFIGGVGIGLASSLSPLYIAEIAPARLRGRLVAINQFTVVLGILAAQITNLLIADAVVTGATVQIIRESWNGQVGWRWMFGSETVPAALFFVLMFLAPESPRWLVKQDRSEKATDILARVGGRSYAGHTVQEIRDTLTGEEIGEVHFMDLANPRLLKILCLGVFLAVFQQWCGINVIFNYAQEVFAAAGYQVGELMFTIVITGVVNLLFTVIAMFTVDSLGRRKLMLFGAISLAVIYLILGIGFYNGSTGIHMLALVVLAIACYAVSLAPITWVVISEIYPNRIRGAATAITVTSLWIGCTALTFTFPILNARLGSHGAFWLYGLICLIGFVVIYAKLPETKGKSLERIEQELIGDPQSTAADNNGIQEIGVPMTGRHKAFTLIELLVVISIIALLVGILLPALGSARRSARNLKCMATERSIGQALFAYATDNNNLLPVAWDATSTNKSTDWVLLTSSYMFGGGDDYASGAEYNKIGALVCPSALIEGGVSTYAPNFLLMNEHPYGRDWFGLEVNYNLDRGRRNSKVLLMADACQFISGDSTGNSPLSLYDMDNAGAIKSTDYYDAKDTDNADPIDHGPNADSDYNNRNLRWRHDSAGEPDGSQEGGTVNVLFLDGHVSPMKDGELLKENIRADG